MSPKAVRAGILILHISSYMDSFVGHTNLVKLIYENSISHSNIKLLS